jgi:hypothetical protein
MWALSASPAAASANLAQIDIPLSPSEADREVTFDCPPLDASRSNVMTDKLRDPLIGAWELVSFFLLLRLSCLVSKETFWPSTSLVHQTCRFKGTRLSPELNAAHFTK